MITARRTGIGRSLAPWALVLAGIGVSCAPAAIPMEAAQVGAASEQREELVRRAPATAETMPSTSESTSRVSPAEPPTTGARPSSAAPTLAPGPVEPDPDYLEELRTVRFPKGYWPDTDFSRHIVPLAEITSGGPPPDGIPPIDNPRFVGPVEADQWLEALEPVVHVEIDGDVRAYPLQIMIWHEIVNDVVGGVPVTVTFCPLCNSAIAFDRRLDGAILDFGTSGNLRNSDLVMYDRQTKSWWQQFSGEAIVGSQAGKRLTFLPALILSWREFRDAYPQGKVLSRETGFSRPYGENPYAGYDRVDSSPFLFSGPLDGRLPPKERVAAVTLGDVELAFPFSILRQERVINYSADSHGLVVFFDPGTRSALGDSSIARAESRGSSAVFDPTVGSRRLTFSFDGERFVDIETGSVWTVFGEATEGPLAGERLTPIVHSDSFWFAWAAFAPDTRIYHGAH